MARRREPEMGRLAYSVTEAAKVLGCSTWLVHRMVDAGDLPVIPFCGRRVLIPVAALEAHLTATAAFRGPKQAS